MMQTEPERQTRKESSRTRQDVDRQRRRQTRKEGGSTRQEADKQRKGEPDRI